ncbi:hypothetical protein D3C76_38010 [compost metagenome]
MTQTSQPLFTQICIVVYNVEQASVYWAKVLGVQPATIELMTNNGLIHYTYGNKMEYSGCRTAKYVLNHMILELIQPAESPSPWRTFLDNHGQGVFHFCLFVDDRKSMYRTLMDIGAEPPYHIGYFQQGSYSYVDTKAQLGLELSINNLTDNKYLMQLLNQGSAQPLDELN